MTALPVRTTQARLDSFAAHLAEPVAVERPTLSEGERRSAEVEARLSLARTRAWLGGALALACNAHGAKPGAYCWADPRAGVRGLCGSRYVAGAASPRPPRPLGMAEGDADLRERAQAIRNAQRDARIRERAAERHAARTASPWRGGVER